jgi:hypothetical protein
MSASASTLSSDHKSILPGIETETSIKTDSISKLTGTNNYQTWETYVGYLLISINVEEIVLKNLQLHSNAGVEELQLYWKMLKR